MGFVVHLLNCSICRDGWTGQLPTRRHSNWKKNWLYSVCVSWLDHIIVSRSAQHAGRLLRITIQVISIVATTCYIMTAKLNTTQPQRSHSRRHNTLVQISALSSCGSVHLWSPWTREQVLVPNPLLSLFTKTHLHNIANQSVPLEVDYNLVKFIKVSLSFGLLFTLLKSSPIAI